MITQARNDTIGLMLSGGIDSAILLAELVKQGCSVQPFYVSTGCVWEREERQAVGKLLGCYERSAVAPVVDLRMPVAELYGRHWSLSGQGVPDETTVDAAVELPGRNPLLLLKPMLWCGQHGISKLALATLANNPFADATAEFFDQFASSLATATAASVQIFRPFEHQSKADVLGLADDLPLDLTFSCLAPQERLHCGVCNKCAERSRNLQAVIGEDPTAYACQRLSQLGI